MIFVPSSRPKITKEKVGKLVAAAGLSHFKVVLVAIRGYYDDSMGVPGENDRSIFDDALVWYTENSFFAVNGNCDPTAQYKQGVAKLKAGVYFYRKGKHGLSRRHPYDAFRQADDDTGNVTVIRDGQGEFTDSPAKRFCINIHRGGLKSTSSEGCLTVYPTQWDAFQHLGYAELDRHKMRTFPVLLIENDGSIA